MSVSVSEWLLQDEECVGEALEAVLCAPESAGKLTFIKRDDQFVYGI